MDLSGYIFLDRDSALYKAPVSSLSSIVLFKEAKRRFMDEMDAVSSSIEKLTSTFEDVLVSKTAIKSEYCSKDQIGLLTSNGSYVFVSTANNVASELCTLTDLSGKTSKKKHIDGWYDTQLSQCFEVLRRGYEVAAQCTHKDVMTREQLSTETNPPTSIIVLNTNETGKKYPGNDYLD